MSPPPFYRTSPNLPVAKASFHKPAAIPRAPIVNPYDKLTQPQFDAFISDITGALRDALGYRADPPPKPKARTQWHIPASPSSEAPEASYDEDADVEMDDSFAEVKARREAAGNAKGKGRDPREGPGLGKGERGAPIEIDLDSEEEEEVEEDEDEWEEEDEDGVQTSDEEEEEENALRNGESSAHAHARYRKYAVRRDDEVEEEEDADADANGPGDAIEVISDDEQDDAPHVNGHPGEDSGEEYSDEEDVNTTSLLVAPPKPTQVVERDYSDEGEETGSESENGDAAGSSPPRYAADPHFQPDRPLHALDDMFGEEDDELDEGVGSSPPRGGHEEPEIIDVGSDDEAEGDEEQVLREDEYAPEDEAEQDEGVDLRIQPQLYIQSEEHDAEDDDVLPGSSPILSSPVEPVHSIQSENHAVFTVEDFEDDGQVDDAHYQSKPFDWDHPPAFARGLPASGSGHLATPMEEEDVADSEEYPQLETFGTSDLLPTYKSLSQTQTESEAEVLQLDEDYRDGVAAEPTSPNLAQEYSVEEVEEDYRDPEHLEDLDAYTISPSISHHFTVEAPFTDHEPDDRGMHIDVESVLGDVDEATYREGELSADVRQEQADIQDPILSEDARELEVILDSALNGQVASEVQLIEPQISVPRNGNGVRLLDDSIPMPVLADPTVDDPSAPPPPTTSPHVPMILSLPGSHILLSPISTPAGQPTPVSLPVPASLLKAMHMRQESGLFTPNSETPSAVATPHPADHSTQADTEPAAVSKTEYFDMESTEDQSQTMPDFSAQMIEVEDAEESLNPLKDEEAIVDLVSDDADEATEQTDNVVVVQESNEQSDAAAEVDATELQQLVPVGETSPGVASTDELVDDLIEEVPVEAALPRDEEDEEIAAAQDEEPAVVPEVNGVTSPSYSEGMDDYVVTSESQAGEWDLAIADGEYNGSTLSSSGVPTEMSLATKATPVPDDPSTLDEHPNILEQTEISHIPVPSLEEKTETEGADGTSQDNELVDLDEMSIDDIELQYPSEPDVEASADVEVEEVEPVEVEGAESVGTADDISEESETDADGDDDPDYEESSASSVVDEEPVVDEKSGVDGEPDVDPASIEPSDPPAQDSALIEQEPELPADLSGPSQQTDVSSTPDAVDDVAPSVEVDATPNGDVEELAEVDDALEEEEDAEGVDKASSSVETNGLTPQPASESIDAEVKPEAVADTPDSPTQAESPPAESTSLKRKREYGSLTKLSSTSSNLGKVAESRLSRPYKSNGKGKAKEEHIDNDDASSTSSASSAARMLNPGSRGTSRASSVASIRSTKSSMVPPESSPSVLSRVNSIIKVTRPTPKLPPPPPPPPPPPLMHAHSHNRAVPHHHHAPSLSRQPTQQQRLIQRTPSRSNIKDKEEMPTPSTSSTQMPALPRAAPAAGSPVTRSNCRYHKISLPEDDENKGGPRVCFLVPGCSLGDRDLMKEEDIQDMGNATMEEGERMVQDLDSLHFSSYLIGILRQLVGVDLLREQEVYYLPPANGEAPRKPRRRAKSKLRISSAGSFASEGSAMSPGVRSPASISSRAPLSAAGSSSTASVQARRRKRSDRGSPTPSSTTRSEQGGEPTDDESPNAKLIRAAEAEGVAAAASGSPLRTRRSKRIDKEAAEYKPEGLETVEESSEEEGKGQRRKKKRGLKRGRQSEAVPAQEGGEERKMKKLKTHESNGSST